ncbi:helix-turn-helix domain-containing protein [Actinoplanes sp. N902-109]|uniref:winged helix-turn-helix transcriptional regulator n=1 Tax=Actinoplanes sp. (strain N902-109) TaxID=649831 RepID=UPI00032952ED|nr:helix-turn-helix domain-containing protein [Actinoplanes sp. N902-109]AGL16202.1 transcriptional regulatory protein [Actinoplanes sp. N902-109]
MAEGAQLPAATHEIFHSDCPARKTIDRVTSRWGVWVLIALRGSDLRFFELRDSIRGVSEKMLSQTLRGLTEDGLVWRQVEPTTPPSVTYGLTVAGFDVAEPLTDLLDRITGGPSAQRLDG